MDETFDLKATMSPQINKNARPAKKLPSTLALKKMLRRSSIFKNQKADESIITVSSSMCNSEICSTSGSSSNGVLLNETPIVISDSEHSEASPEPSPKKFTALKNKAPDFLPHEKFKNIVNWLDDVAVSQVEDLMFSRISAIQGDNYSKCKSSNNVATSSTMSNPVRFDQLFKAAEDNGKYYEDSPPKDAENGDIIEDSFSDKLIRKYGVRKNLSAPKVVNDSYKDSPEVRQGTPLKKSEDSDIESSICNKVKGILHDSFENQLSGNIDAGVKRLLDGLYGDSWKKEHALATSEPKPRKKAVVNIKPANTTIKMPKNKKKPRDDDDNWLKKTRVATSNKYLESPLIKSLRAVCDPDTESDNDSSPINKENICSNRLNFSDCDDDDYLKSDVRARDKKIDARYLGNLSSDSEQSFEEPKIVNAKPRTQKTDNLGNYTFLASLSSSVPLEQCNSSARIYRNSFKKFRDKLTKLLFTLFNKKIFDNAIPEVTQIDWNGRLRGTAGMCLCKKIIHKSGTVERIVKIVLSVKVLDAADRLRDTLIHEMCHAATWIVNECSDGHGPLWKAWAQRAMKTFPELPPIERCHNYKINTKYTYKCVNCGYSIGRHTKSLNTERKRCGYCYGKFEVFVNKKTKEGKFKTVVSTPKRINPFAQFVKHNYADCKTPERTHGDVMKILGQKFSTVKV